jgi:hypothetical protein
LAWRHTGDCSAGLNWVGLGELELVLDVAKHFRVKAARAKEIVSDVETAVGQWRAEAKRAGILRAEQDRMASAFRLISDRGRGSPARTA